MMEQKLDLILEKLGSIETDVKTLKSGQQELNQIVPAIRSNQEMFNATMDGLEKGIKELNNKLEDNISDLNKAIRYLNHRLSDLELEVLKLK